MRAIKLTSRRTAETRVCTSYSLKVCFLCVKPFSFPDNEWFIYFKTSSCPTRTEYSFLQPISVLSPSHPFYVPLDPSCSSKSPFNPTQKRKTFYFGPHLRLICPSGVTVLVKVTHRQGVNLKPIFNNKLLCWRAAATCLRDFCWQLLIFISSALRLDLNYCSTHQTQLAAGSNSIKRGGFRRKDKLVIHIDKEYTIT